MTIPYFYIIQHKPSGKKYAGSRTGTNCDPAELMVAGGYLTSSKSIKTLIDIDGINSFEILKIIKGIDVYEYESLFLKEHNCADSLDWLNLHNNDRTLPANHPKFKEHMLRVYGVEYASQSPEIRKKAKQTLISRYGVDSPAKSKEIQEKTQKTILEKYGVTHCSKLESSRNRASHIKHKEVDAGNHWCQNQNNKKIISEATKRQGQQGRLYLQTKQGREEQSIRRSLLNKEQNKVRANRPVVDEVRALFELNNFKLPHGGLHNRTEKWLRDTKISILSGSYVNQNRKYYNDGAKNYMLFESDPRTTSLSCGMVNRLKGK